MKDSDSNKQWGRVRFMSLHVSALGQVPRAPGKCWRWARVVLGVNPKQHHENPK